MIRATAFATAVWCFIAQSQFLLGAAFQPSSHVATRRTLQMPTANAPAASITRLDLLPEIQHSSIQQLSTSLPTTSNIASSILLSSEDVESWRQYVPLVVSVGVIVDILLGSPLANLALGPMKRASEKGATGDSTGEDDSNSAGGGSLFSAFSGKFDSGSVDRSKERVDSAAIAQAALDKAYGTLELKKFLEENKSDEQRYEEVRKKIDQQMEELED